MRRIVGAVAIGVVAGLLHTSTAQAQGSIYVAGGASIPFGDYGEYAKTGWITAGGFTVAVGGKGVSVGGELLFGSNKHEGTSGDKTNLFGGYGFVQYRAGDPAKPGVYFFGQAGVLDHQYKPGTSGVADTDDWKFSFGGGAGIDIPVGKVALFIEARAMFRDGTNFIPIMAGIAFPFGQRN